ncbi:MAG: TIGR00296 family protein [Candidatus Aenigmatarchaeota archaeon]
MKDFILKLAREAIETYVKTSKKIPIPNEYPKELNKKKGVFVTIYKRPKELRGCIGLPYPQKPLIEGIIEAAIEACEDPRFEPLKEEELKDIFIEVSILTKPELIKVKNPKDYLKEIKIGKHGLILINGSYGGLFLPQVPVEQNWNCEEYLENLCYKAGLTSDAWLDPLTRIYRFETKIFSEK